MVATTRIASLVLGLAAHASSAHARSATLVAHAAIVSSMALT
jgi:hypothetical protein